MRVLIKRFASAKQPRTITVMETQALPEGFPWQMASPKAKSSTQIFVQVRLVPTRSSHLASYFTVFKNTHTSPWLHNPHNLHTLILQWAYELLPVTASGCTNQPQKEKGKQFQLPSSHTGPKNKPPARSDSLVGLSHSLLPKAGLDKQWCSVHLSAVPQLVGQHCLTPMWHLQLTNQNVFSDTQRRILQVLQCKEIRQESFGNLNNYIFLPFVSYRIVL